MQEFIGRGELAERQQRIGKVLASVKNLSEVFNLATVITNQVTADPGASAAFVPDAKKAVGGNIVAHITDARVMLRCVPLRAAARASATRICPRVLAPCPPTRIATSHRRCGASHSAPPVALLT